MGKSEPRNRQKLKPYNQALKYTGLGFQLAATLGIMGWLGYWIDNQLGTLPLFMVLLILIGLSGSIYLLIKSQNNESKE